MSEKKCPVCKVEPEWFFYSNLDFDGELGPYQYVTCTRCETAWTESYTYAGYEIIIQGEMPIDEPVVPEVQ